MTYPYEYEKSPCRTHKEVRDDLTSLGLLEAARELLMAGYELIGPEDREAHIHMSTLDPELDDAGPQLQIGITHGFREFDAIEPS